MIINSLNSIKVSNIIQQESYLPNDPDLENLKSFLNGILKVSKSLISYKIFKSGIRIPEIIEAFISDLKVILFPGFLTIQGKPTLL